MSCPDRQWSLLKEWPVFLCRFAWSMLKWTRWPAFLSENFGNWMEEIKLPINNLEGHFSTGWILQILLPEPFLIFPFLPLYLSLWWGEEGKKGLAIQFRLNLNPLQSFSWPQTHSGPPPSTSLVLGLWVCTTTPNSCQKYFYLNPVNSLPAYILSEFLTH